MIIFYIATQTITAHSLKQHTLVITRVCRGRAQLPLSGGLCVRSHQVEVGFGSYMASKPTWVHDRKHWDGAEDQIPSFSPLLSQAGSWLPIILCPIQPSLCKPPQRNSAVKVNAKRMVSWPPAGHRIHLTRRLDIFLRLKDISFPLVLLPSSHHQVLFFWPTLPLRLS